MSVSIINPLLCSMPLAVLVAVFHNELRYLTAELLSEVCTDVGIELRYATTNCEDGA